MAIKFESVLAGIEANRQVLAMIALLIAVQIVGIWLGLNFFPHGFGYTEGGVFSKLVSWDGRDYLAVAMHGYTWNKVYCVENGHFCNIAFFPGQALIDKLILFVFGTYYGVATALLSLVYGIISIFCFFRLAHMVMGQGARNATFLFALYPGSTFYLMGYPTGLISILIILAISRAIKNQWWESALYLGIGSAVAPTIIFVGLPLGVLFLVEHFKKNGIPLFLLNIAGWAALALSGLLLFMLYQYITFGDATAFITSQQAWGGNFSYVFKIHLLMTLKIYLFYYHEATAWYKAAYQSMIHGHYNDVIPHDGMSCHISDYVYFLWLSLVNIVFFAIGWIGIILAWFFCTGRRIKYLVCASGCCVLLGYMWFTVAGDWNMESTIRLIFPAMALFIGWGGLLNKFKLLEYTFFPFFVVISLLQTACLVAGYAVV